MERRKQLCIFRAVRVLPLLKGIPLRFNPMLYMYYYFYFIFLFYFFSRGARILICELEDEHLQSKLIRIWGGSKAKYEECNWRLHRRRGHYKFLFVAPISLILHTVLVNRLEQHPSIVFFNALTCRK